MRCVASKLKRTLEELLAWREELKSSGAKLVVTNGCFDLCHPGHVAYLEYARSFGDAVLVGVNTDVSIRALKGDTRPINTEADRLIMVAALEAVDAVYLFQGTTATSFLASVSPDVWVKSSDLSLGRMNQDERQVLEYCGSAIRFVPFVEGKSTTAIVNRLGDSLPTSRSNNG